MLHEKTQQPILKLDPEKTVWDGLTSCGHIQKTCFLAHCECGPKAGLLVGARPTPVCPGLGRVDHRPRSGSSRLSRRLQRLAPPRPHRCLRRQRDHRGPRQQERNLRRRGRGALAANPRGPGPDQGRLDDADNPDVSAFRINSDGCQA